MDPAFDNCNIGEFDNSEKVLIGNANSQLDIKSDQNAEFFDEHDQPVKQTTKELLKQFNDGLNNFIQEKTNQTENILNNDFNNAFSNIETELIDRQNDFENDFLKNNDNDLNLQMAQQISQNENFDDNVASGIDMTDDIAMQTTETSEATTNLLDDHSTLSNSKDTLSENPFDNRLPEANADDAKSTPMISPNSEEVPHHDELINDDEQHQDYLKLNGNGQFSDFDEKSLSERNDEELKHFHDNSEHDVHENIPQEFNDNLQEILQENSKDFHENPLGAFHGNPENMFNGNQQEIPGNSHENFHENLENSHKNLQPDFHENLQDLHENSEQYIHEKAESNPQENPQDFYDHTQDIHEQPFEKHINEEEDSTLNKFADELIKSGSDIEDKTAIDSDMEKPSQVIDENVINLPELGEVDELQNYQQQYLDNSAELEQAEQRNLDVMNENQIDELKNNSGIQEFPPQYDNIHELPSELPQLHKENHKDNAFDAQDMYRDHDDFETNPFCQEINETQIQKEIHNEVQEVPQHSNELDNSSLQEPIDLNLESQNQESPENLEPFEKTTKEENAVCDEFNLKSEIEDNIGEQNLEENIYQGIDNKELENNGHENEDISGHNQEIENLMKKNSDDEPFDQKLDQHQQSVDPLQSTQEQILSCDASEDESNYMRLKEGDSEKHELELNETEKHITESVEKSIKTEEVLNDQFEIKSQEPSNNLIPQENNNQQQQKLVIDLNSQPDLDDDMNHQLNPEAKEFVPSTSPLENNEDAPKFPFYNRVGDEVVSQSPNKNAVMNMDEILLPNEQQFDCEADHRPHEFGIQQLNFKEATHAPEKELVSPINEEYFRGIDLHKQMSAPAMVGFHPIAEFENANMKDSIYIENPTAQETFEMERVEHLMNSVQPIPQDILYGASGDFILEDNAAMNGGYEIDKDVLMGQDYDEQLAMFKEANGVTTFMQQIIHDENIPQKIHLDNFHQTAQNTDETVSQQESDFGFSVQESSSETTTGLASDAPIEVVTEKPSTKVAEKNLKNKLDLKSGKVPDGKKPLLNRAASASSKKATDKPTSIASKAKSTTSEKVNKPKTITVATAPAPKTISFPRPRTGSTMSKASPSASVASTTEKKSHGPSERKVIEKKPTTTTNKVKSDVKSPPTLVIKKPSPSKPETKAETKSATSSIRSTTSKTGLTSKSTVSAKAPATTVPKPRPASANNTTSSFSKTTSKPAVSTLRTATQSKTSPTPKTASPRGTTVKSPTKPLSSTSSTLTKTTTTTTRTSGATTANRMRPASATTTSSITKTQPTRTSAGTVRKTTTTTVTTTKQNNTVTPPKKPAPIKRPQTATSKVITDNSKDIKVTDPSNITKTSTTTTTIIQQEVPIKEIENLIISDDINLQNDEPKLNGSHITTDEVTAV